MLLEVLLGGGHELDSDELVAMQSLARDGVVEKVSWGVPSALEAHDDLADEATLEYCVNGVMLVFACVVMHTWTPSGLIAMKLFGRQSCFTARSFNGRWGLTSVLETCCLFVAALLR